MAKVKIDKNLCKGCKLCIVFCPAGKIKLGGKLNKKGIYTVEFVDKEGKKCTGCAQCAIMCPEAAITVYQTKSSGAKCKSAGCV